eukprot:6035192-Prymnesium_polylepis.1
MSFSRSIACRLQYSFMPADTRASGARRSLENAARSIARAKRAAALRSLKMTYRQATRDRHCERPRPASKPWPPLPAASAPLCDRSASPPLPFATAALRDRCPSRPPPA